MIRGATDATVADDTIQMLLIILLLFSSRVHTLSYHSRHRASHALLRSIFPEDLVQYAHEHGLLQEIVEPQAMPSVDYMSPF